MECIKTGLNKNYNILFIFDLNQFIFLKYLLQLIYKNNIKRNAGENISIKLHKIKDYNIKPTKGGSTCKEQY
jgi:hypothetical protein